MRVIINGAMTVDGKIATVCGDSAISSKQDLQRVHRLRANSDAVVVGISTVLADDPRLTVRLAGKGASSKNNRGKEKKKKKKDPVRVVVDSRCRIPSNSRLLRTAKKIKTIIASSEHASDSEIERVQRSGAEVIVAGKEKVDLKVLFSKLANKGLEKILVEGGGELNWSVLRLNLADKLIVTIAPRIAGGRLATTIVEGDGYNMVSDGPMLDLVRLQKIKGTGELVLFFNVVKEPREKNKKNKGKMHSTF
jgi:2,5-diamino-6-(ribosylamino)-4(3H)-pyrimidinone 5'-phosphate reductase